MIFFAANFTVKLESAGQKKQISFPGDEELVQIKFQPAESLLRMFLFIEANFDCDRSNNDDIIFELQFLDNSNEVLKTVY